jgi:hypothetical protein
MMPGAQVRSAGVEETAKLLDVDRPVELSFLDGVPKLLVRGYRAKLFDGDRKIVNACKSG